MSSLLGFLILYSTNMASMSTTTVNVVEGDNKEFMKMAASKLNWGDLSDAEMVMDIGCGAGKSCEMIADLFPNVKTIVGIDKIEFMPSSPEKNKSQVQIKHYVADIQNRSSLLEWDGKMTRIFSINCFNFVKDKEGAFQNVYHLLKPGGGAAILFYLTSPLYDCLEQLLKMFKWEKYEHLLNSCNDPGRCTMTCEQFRTICEKIGFEIVDCEITDRSYIYSSEEIFKTHIHHKLSGMTSIPSDMFGEFKKDYRKHFKKMNGRSSDGRPCMKYQLMNILLKKN